MSAFEFQGTVFDPIISGNIIESNGDVFEVTATVTDLLLADNKIKGGGFFANNAIVRGRISSNRFEQVAGTAIRIEADIDSGLEITNNDIIEPTQHGIVLADGSGEIGVDDCGVERNRVIDPGSTTDDTYDGILIDGHSSENRIIGNRVRPRASGNQTRNGVHIATSDNADNIVVGNNLKPAADYGTLPITDAGTNTILDWPDDATYGDNFT